MPTTHSYSFFFSVAVLMFICAYGVNTHAATYTISASFGSQKPEPVQLNQTTSRKVNLSVSGTDDKGRECTIDQSQVTYSITQTPNKPVQYASGLDSSPEDDTSGYCQPSFSTSGSSGTVSVICSQGGYYVVPVTISASWPASASSCGAGSATGDQTPSFVIQASDFTFNIKPSQVSMPPGGTNKDIIVTVKPLFGFSGHISISLSDPAGLSGSASVDIPSGSTADQTTPLSVSATSTIPPKEYAERVNASFDGAHGVHLGYGQSATITVFKTDFYISGPYDVSYHKAGDGIQEANVRNKDGSITTDSILSFDDKANSDPWRASSALTALPTPDNPIFYTYLWTSSHGTFDSTTTPGPVYQVNESESSDSSHPFIPTTANVQITDGLSAAGGNSYTINWHHGYEGWQEDKSKPHGHFSKRKQKHEGSGFNCSAAYGIPHASWTFYDYDYDQLISSAQVLNAVGQAYAVSRPFSALANVIGLSYDKLTELVNETKWPNGGTDINAYNVFVSGISDPYARSTYDPNPVTTYAWKDSLTDAKKLEIANHYMITDTYIWVAMDDIYYKGDEYDTTGYKGPIEKDVLKHIDGSEIYPSGVFVLNTIK